MLRAVHRSRALAFHLKPFPFSRALTTATVPESHKEVIPFYDDKVAKYAQREIHPVTLKRLMQLGQPPLTFEKMLDSARYARSELPVRLARRVRALQNLPFIVGTNPYIRNVYKLYYDSLVSIGAFPEVTTPEEDERFVEMLEGLVEGHANIIPTLARGFLECKKYMSPKDIKAFLDEMIRARIGIRLIAEQTIALHHSHGPEHIGIIHTRLNPAKLIRTSANFVQDLCDVHYGSAPEIVISGETEAEFTYIPVHLEYIICELLKNSFRATVEHSQRTGRLHHPPVEVTVSRGAEEIGIRLRDQGGGVEPRDLPSIFDYSYTTVKPDDLAGGDGGENIFTTITKTSMQTGIGGPIAGLGFGLPLARIYAQYFGGSIDLVSLHGWGCDVFLRLRHIDESLGDLQI
ncbi:uncharacterized protein VTP21DRAFT_5264 [Calcarisporiella thermophila]|uniref:uncharacterized protein n=1 Tax=Calcarisporiella thermophila TaxID=911321 RepID=UPI003742011B